MHSWRVLILPYIEGGELAAKYRFDEPWDGPNNRLLASRMPRVFAFHTEKRPGNTTTNYVAVVGDETAWPTNGKCSIRDATDGTTTTILLVENRGLNIHWLEPRDLSFADMDCSFNSPKGVSSPYREPAIAMLNGELSRLDRTISARVLRAMLTIRGGEVIESGEKGEWRVLEDGRKRPLGND